MRTQIILCLTLGLAACSSSTPNSNAGVGLDDYNNHIGEQGVSPSRHPDGQALTGFSPDIATAAIDRATGAQDPNQPAYQQSLGSETLDSNRPDNNAPSTIQTQSDEEVYGNTGISDEQNFDAVARRETIESDKQRIKRNREQYQVIQPTAIPKRKSTKANIVEYALTTMHNPGTQMYTRFALRLRDPLVACARYSSPDLAQQAFLEAGGPKRDRKGLDPDGDGFACNWDPRPFRLK